MGCRSFIVCGGAGTLHADLTLGHFVVVSSALRDEGTSFHYLPPARRIEADAVARRVLEEVLTSRHVPYVSGLTWTTDAPYRETPKKIAARREEGCLTVDMEAAALAAIARFRAVPLAQVVYCGDDLSGSSWDHRSWQNLSDVREELFDITATAALALAHSNR
jgi:uridine phosphorylase